MVTAHHTPASTTPLACIADIDAPLTPADSLWLNRAITTAAKRAQFNGFDDSATSLPHIRSALTTLRDALIASAPPLAASDLSTCIADAFVDGPPGCEIPQPIRVTVQVSEGHLLQQGDIAVKISDGLFEMFISVPPSHGRSVLLAIEQTRIATVTLKFMHTPTVSEPAYVGFDYEDVTDNFKHAQTLIGDPVYLMVTAGMTRQEAKDAAVAAHAAANSGIGGGSGVNSGAGAGGGGSGGSGGNAGAGAGDGGGSAAAGAPDHGRNFGFPDDYHGECTCNATNGEVWAQVQEMDETGRWIDAKYNREKQKWHSGKLKRGFSCLIGNHTCMKDFIGAFPPISAIQPDCYFADLAFEDMIAPQRRNTLSWYVGTQLFRATGYKVRCKYPDCLLYWIRQLYPNPPGLDYIGFDFAAFEWHPEPESGDSDGMAGSEYTDSAGSDEDDATGDGYSSE